MKHLINILLSLFLLASCSQEEAVRQEGYLDLSGIRLQHVQTETLSRVVSEEWGIRILKDDALYEGHDYQPGEAPSGLTLPVGTGYAVEAFSSNYPDGGNEGSVYYAKEPFAIEAGKQTIVSVAVPMTNFGVSLRLPDNFATFFPTYIFSMTYGEKTVELTEGETAYFDLQEGAELTYTLSATNIDGDSFTQDSQQSVTPVAGTIYTVSYEVESGSLQLVE